MLKAEFKHYPLKLIEPNFDSPLTDLIIDLNLLREKRLMGSTHPQVFFQLKHIFHTLESVGSARIEGNNTTVTEYIETKLEHKSVVSEEIKEIQNIEKATTFVEDHVKDYPINRTFVSEIHKIIVDGLSPEKEGDRVPGAYRKRNIIINHAAHLPPDHSTVDSYMDELFGFIANSDTPKYDLLKTAIAHHRFVWIHPFANGNGRTVRLLTYAMLVKQGFNVDVGRILNPTAVFCNSRNDYYRYLAEADKGTNDGILSWCEYVLRGLKHEIDKIDKLLDYTYLRKEILLPMIEHSLQHEYITQLESRILKKAIDKKIIKAADLRDVFPGKVQSEISRQIRKLITKKMLVANVESPRKYVLRFDNSYLLRAAIQVLGEKNFLSVNDRDS